MSVYQLRINHFLLAYRFFFCFCFLFFAWCFHFFFEVFFHRVLFSQSTFLSHMVHCCITGISKTQLSANPLFPQLVAYLRTWYLSHVPHIFRFLRTHFLHQIKKYMSCFFFFFSPFNITGMLMPCVSSSGKMQRKSKLLQSFCEL